MTATKPTATGTLAATPLPHLLVYVLDRRLTGSLVVEQPGGGKSAVFFENGVPQRAKTHDPVVTLGGVLLELGAIDQAKHDATLKKVASEKRLHGEILLAEGAINRDALLLGLREQLSRKVEWMFALPPDSVFGYYDQLNLLERWGGRESPRVVPLALLARGLRRHADPARVEATLQRLGDRPLKLHLDSRVALFELLPSEQAVADLLRAKPQSVAELRGSGAADPAVVARVIYLLTITRHLDLGSAEKRPVGVDAAAVAKVSRVPARRQPSFASVVPEARPVGASDEPARRGPTQSARPANGPIPEAKVAEMRARAEKLSGQNYYDILGVPQDATKSVIQGAFFQLAKTWHPDRLAGFGEDTREMAARAFSRMSEAHQILTDDARRAEYDALLKQGGGSAEEQEKVASVLRAVGHFQKAEVLFKKGNLAQAEAEARAAADEDGDQPEYVALLAWITAQKAERTTSGNYDDLIATLTKLIAKHPGHERSRFYRAQLLKRSGRMSKAIKDFQWIAENNPKNLDAAREIRLYRMRQGDERSSGAKERAKEKDRDSIFGKFFKR